jgi:exosortase/archaeosortase family protein
MPAATIRRTDLGRSQLFFGVFLITTLNGFFGHALRAVEEAGLAAAAMNLFGVSAILWVALAAALALLSDRAERRPLIRGDLPVAALACLAALLPVATAASLALALVSLWVIATSPPRSPLRRAAIIFLAVTGALLWGRLMLATFSGPLLSADALFVAKLIGATHQGNTLWIGGDKWSGIVVAPGCSSMQGMSLALVFWATVNQYFDVRFGWRPALYCLAALAGTIAVNVLRIGAMLRWPEHLEEIHHGWGYHIAMWTTLVLVVAICLTGARRQVFRAY